MREEELSCFSFQRRPSLCVKFRLACEVDFPVVWLCEKVTANEIRCIMLIKQTRQTCEYPAHSKIVASLEIVTLSVSGDEMWRRLSDRIKGEEASLTKWLNKSRSHGFGQGVLMASSRVQEKRAKTLQRKHPVVLVCAWLLKRHQTSSSNTARRRKSSGVNCQSRKVINFRYENCYRLTIMDSLSRYIKVNVQLLFYTVVMHHCY